jgi:hypothetical protein
MADVQLSGDSTHEKRQAREQLQAQLKEKFVRAYSQAALSGKMRQDEFVADANPRMSAAELEAVMARKMARES